MYALLTYRDCCLNILRVQVYGLISRFNYISCSDNILVMKYALIAVLLVIFLVLWSMGDDNLQSPGEQRDWNENGSVKTRASWWIDNYRDVECP